MVDSIRIAEMTQAGAGLLPGFIGQSASVAMAYPVAIMKENQRREELARQLSTQNLAAINDPALKRILKALEQKTADAVRNSAVSAAGAGVGALTGAAIGGAITTFAIPVPILGTVTGQMVGALIGTVVGGMGASKVDDMIFTTESNDAFAIKASIEDDLKKGIAVSEVKMFALLASSLPDIQLKELNRKLSIMSGGEVETIEQAVKEGKRKLLEQLMVDGSIDAGLLSVSTGLKPIPGMTIAGQFTHMVNSGMDVNVLMRPDWREHVVAQMNMNNLEQLMQQGVDVAGPDGSPLPVDPVAHDAGRRVPGAEHRRSSSNKNTTQVG